MSPALSPSNRCDLTYSHRLARILSAYTTGEPFSTDVPAAILRQGEFIEQLHQLGWLEATLFANSDALLHRANVRYHA